MSKIREQLEDVLFRAYVRAEEAHERRQCVAGHHDEAVTPPGGFPAGSLTQIGDRLIEPGTRYCRRCDQILETSGEHAGEAK